MATYVNYTSLVADVTNYIERGASLVTDATVYNQIPRLINAAERKLIQMLKLLGQNTVLVNPTGISAGVSVLTKPDRWRQTISMNYGGGSDKNVRVPIYPRSYEYCRAFWPDDSQTSSWQTLDASDRPTLQPFYADYDLQHWLLAPTPTETLPLEVQAYLQPPLLDQNNQNNFFTQYTPNALLYGALLEATPFLKGDERISVWQGYYDKELSSLSGQDLQRILDRAAERRTV